MTITGLTSIIEWEKKGWELQSPGPGASKVIPTEHNRSELSVDVERIESSDRMANGRLRKYHVADKRSWSVSWDMLPAPTSETVDGKAGGIEMENFYYSTPGEFTMHIKHADSTLDESVQVVFTNFNKTHVRRGKIDFWDLSVSMEEC